MLDKVIENVQLFCHYHLYRPALPIMRLLVQHANSPSLTGLNHGNSPKRAFVTLCRCRILASTIAALASATGIVFVKGPSHHSSNFIYKCFGLFRRSNQSFLQRMICASAS